MRQQQNKTKQKHGSLYSPHRERNPGNWEPPHRLPQQLQDEVLLLWEPHQTR